MCQSKRDGGRRCPSAIKKALTAVQSELAHDPFNPALLARRDDLNAELERTKEAKDELQAFIADPNTNPADATAAQRKLDALNKEHPDREPETAFTRKYDNPKEQYEAFRKEIENAYASIEDAAAYKELLDTVAKFHSYSYTNQVLIRLQRPDATKVAGFKKWETEFGRTVKKGSRAIRIFAPSTIRVPLKGKDGKPMLDDSGKEMTTQKTVFRLVPVFADTQTEGKPLPTGVALSEEPPEGFVDDLTSAITAEGFEVEYGDTGLKGGYTDGHSKRVVINAALSPAGRARTLAHELGHIKAGHLDRVEDYHTGVGGCRGEMEMEAESIAYIVCRSNGMSTDMSATSSNYIKGWRSTTHEQSLEETFKTVSGTVKSLLTEGKWRNLNADD